MARSFIDRLLMRDADAGPVAQDRPWARKSEKGRFGIKRDMISAEYQGAISVLPNSYEADGTVFTKNTEGFKNACNLMLLAEKRAIREADTRGSKTTIGGSRLFRLPTEGLMSEGERIANSGAIRAIRVSNDVLAIKLDTASDKAVLDGLLSLSHRAANLLKAHKEASFSTRGKPAEDGSITLRFPIPERLQKSLAGNFTTQKVGKQEYHVIKAEAMMDGSVDMSKIIKAQNDDARKEAQKKEQERISNLQKLGVEPRKDPSFITRLKDGSASISLPMRAKGLSKFFEEAGADISASGSMLSAVLSLEDTKKIEPMFPWIKAELDAVNKHSRFDGSEKAVKSRLSKAVERSSGQRVNDMSDLFNPASPISLLNPLSPFNPLNPIYASGSDSGFCVTPTSDYNPSSGSSWSSSDYSSSSSSSYDSGSSSSYDSGSSSSPSCD